MSGAPASTPSDLLRDAIGQAQAGRLPDAIATVRNILSAEPTHAAANGLMGTLLHASGRGAEAVPFLERAHSAAPDEPRMAYQLGAILSSTGQIHRGIALMRRAIDLSPGWTQGLNGLANTLYGAGDYEGAEAAWRQSLAVQPGQADTLCGLGGLMIVSGRPFQAIDFFREAARAHPASAEVLGKLVSALNYDQAATPQEIGAAHAAWGRALSPGAPWRAPNSREPERRLRIGLLPPDLYDHSCPHFPTPIPRHPSKGIRTGTYYRILRELGIERK